VAAGACGIAGLAGGSVLTRYKLQKPVGDGFWA
jgi:hypothetical protein